MKLKNTLLCLLLAVALTGCTLPVNTAEQATTDHLSSIRYRLYPLTDPRPIRVHVLTIDLSKQKVEPVAVLAEDPPGEDCDAIRTDPRKLAQHPLLQAFINVNPWTPWSPDYPTNVKISGLAATGGVVYSPHHGVSVWTDKQGRVHIGDPGDAEIQEGVGGFEQILKDKHVTANPGGPLHPRTAIGTSRDGRRLYWVVADGRQPGFSEGMSLDELARFMKKLGCRDAANMDGGGSSVMGIVDKDGNIQILNSPPGAKGTLRALPIILTIRLAEKREAK